MRLLVRMSRLALCAGGLLLATGVLSAGEKKLMHCFAFTPLPGATEADWQDFYKATDALPGKIPGLDRVWYGKLRQNLTVFSTSSETRKKLAAREENVTGPVSALVRGYGVCMEMNSLETLKTYTAHPAHQDWEKVYSKVRQPGTTTFDIVGQ